MLNKPPTKNRIQLTEPQKDYMLMVALAAFVVLFIAAVITLSFRIVMGTIVLGIGLGYFVYIGRIGQD